jgi:hypothetical protein
VRQRAIKGAIISTRSSAAVRESSTAADNELAIFNRLIEPGDPALSPPVAHYILALDFLLQERVRMHELAVKAQDGTLSAEEAVQMDSYERVGHLLSIWKSKARKALKNAGRNTR